HGASESLLTLMESTHNLDVDGTGRLYVDQIEHPLEVLRFASTSADPADEVLRAERLAGPFYQRVSSVVANPLKWPNGGLLLSAKVAGRNQLMVTYPGKKGIPLLHDSREETALPAVLIGPKRLAFTVRVGDRRQLRIAALEDGHAVLEPIELGVDCSSLDAL